MSDLVRAPFPWFGGKRRVADVVWRAFGPDVPNYITAAALRGRKQSDLHLSHLSEVRRGRVPVAARDAAARANRGRRQAPAHVEARIAPLVGRARPEQRRLSAEQVIEIRKRRVSQRCLAARFCVAVSTIHAIQHGRRYADVQRGGLA